LPRLSLPTKNREGFEPFDESGLPLSMTHVLQRGMECRAFSNSHGWATSMKAMCPSTHMDSRENSVEIHKGDVKTVVLANEDGRCPKALKRPRCGVWKALAVCSPYNTPTILVDARLRLPERSADSGHARDCV